LHLSQTRTWISNTIFHGFSIFNDLRFRQLPALTSLETLQMRNTQRTLSNFPLGVDTLFNLQGNNYLLDVDSITLWTA
jgi:hypothetical protein